MEKDFESIDVKVRIYPTEVEERVRTAVLNIFPDAVLELEKGDPYGTLYCKVSDLETLMVKLRDQKIRATARKVLLKCINGQVLQFNLNKQAALVGRVNFSDGGSVLGEISVKITTGEPEALLEWLTSWERKGEEE